MHRRSYGDRAVGEHRDIDGGGQRRLQLRQQLLDPVDDLDHVGAGLALDIDDDRRLLIRPGSESRVLCAVDDVGNVGESHRRAVAVGDDHALVFVGALQLIVGVDRRRPRRPVEAALGLVGVGIADRGAHVVEREAVGRQRGRIGLDPHRRPLSAAQRNQPHPRQLRQLGCEPRVGEILDLRQRHRLGRQRQGHDRRVGRIDLVVDRRRRKVGREEAAGCVDRRLHFLLGDVQRKIQVELQRDDRCAARAGRRHLLQSRHLSELPLERRGDRRGRDVGTRPRIQRHHLYRRIVDLRQRRNRQHAVRDDAGEQDRQHQQRGRDRAQDERARRVHRNAFIGFAALRRRARQPPPLLRRPWPFCPLAGARRILARRRRLLRRPCGGVDQFDARAVTKLVGAVDDDQIPWSEPFADLGRLARDRAELHRGHRDGLVLLDQEDECARRAALDGGRRDQRRVLMRFDHHAHVDELVRKQRAVGVGKFGLDLDRPGGRVDLIVDRQQPAGREPGLAAAIECIDCDRLCTLHALDDARHIVLRHRIDDGDRLHLSDRHQSVAVAGMDDISRIDLPQSDPAADRRDDARIGELQPGIVDRALVGLDGPLKLANQRRLRVDLLLGDRILREQRLVALEIDLRVFQLRLVARHLSVRLRQHHFERPRIDLREQVARLDILALAEGDAHQLSVDASADDDFVARGRPCPARRCRRRYCPCARARRRRARCEAGITLAARLGMVAAAMPEPVPGGQHGRDKAITAMTIQRARCERGPGRVRRAVRRPGPCPARVLEERARSACRDRASDRSSLGHTRGHGRWIVPVRSRSFGESCNQVFGHGT